MYEKAYQLSSGCPKRLNMPNNDGSPKMNPFVLQLLINDKVIDYPITGYGIVEILEKLGHYMTGTQQLNNIFIYQFSYGKEKIKQNPRILQYYYLGKKRSKSPHFIDQPAWEENVFGGRGAIANCQHMAKVGNIWTVHPPSIILLFSHQVHTNQNHKQKENSRPKLPPSLNSKGEGHPSKYTQQQPLRKHWGLEPFNEE